MAIMDRSMEGKRQYTTGISKGVFFGEDGKAFQWNGLISVTEKPQANAPTPVYNSLGEKYDQFGNIAEKKHSLTCYTYPEEMDEFLGIEYLEEMGYSVDERPPKKFSMAYRTELGDGLYEIHVLLNQIATFADTAKNTITNNITPTVVTMNLEGVPDPRIKTSHIILDSRLPLTASAERLLFGDNMVDGNINEFLDAEPTWVTVATNYAPIIEPDYDNMVWLGGENLFSYARFGDRSNWATSGTYKYHDGFLELKPNTEYIYSVESVPSTRPNEWHVLNLLHADENGNKNESSLSTKGRIYSINTSRGMTPNMATQFTTGPTGRVYFSYYDSNGKGMTTPGWWFTEVFNNIKIEEGSVKTPWTPAPSDNYVPPADQPRPHNYVPGVKNSKFLPVDDQHKCTPYYDVARSGLGVYANTNDILGYVRHRIYSRLAPNGFLDVDYTFSTYISGARSSIMLQYPSTSSTTVDGPEERLQTVSHRPILTSDAFLRIYNKGGTGAVLVARELLIAESSYSGGFFDVNTTPKTRGDRYVRVSEITHDYTEHQQLMLQSKSRVILSDITPNQYTLEASDSQLRVDGQTFTFKGPQATPVGDDQFTINDEIYGED